MRVTPKPIPMIVRTPTRGIVIEAEEESAIGLGEDEEEASDKVEVKASPKKVGSKGQIALLASGSRKNPQVNLDEHNSQTLTKHSDKLRYKAAYAANMIADDIIRVFKYKGKRDKEYLKGLVWSFGVLYDKVAGGAAGDVVTVRIPARLLDNVTMVLRAQAAKRAPTVVSPTAETVSAVPLNPLI